ncbi:phosphotransferase [Sphaerisporangium sp. NPDC051011]|uniref:phosphotransferase n=1 Tax=Sphaerisporangium sp. NPDC051011 TaxID=3155792 RepID=UPI0033D937A2
MKDRPEGLEDTALVSAVSEGWDVRVRSATYLPLGAGSYHWAVEDDGGRSWFVTADDLGSENDAWQESFHDLGSDSGRKGSFEDQGGENDAREVAFERLGRAFATAVALRRDAGLAFVLAPIPARTGAPLWRIDPRYAVSVFPMLDGEAGEFGAHRPDDRPDVIRLLTELHRATPVVAATAPRTDLTLPGRDRLEDALNDLGRTWDGGPFSEPARRLLATRARDVERSLAAFDRLVRQVRETADTWVVTHGEPHPGNLVRTAAGLTLIDWDTVQIAPPERDLWMLTGAPPAEALAVDSTADPLARDSAADVLARDSADHVRAVKALAEYTRATGHTVDPAALALYPLWWKLADIAIFTNDLRRPHSTTEDSTASWHYLNGYLKTP